MKKFLTPILAVILVISCNNLVTDTSGMSAEKGITWSTSQLSDSIRSHRLELNNLNASNNNLKIQVKSLTDSIAKLRTQRLSDSSANSKQILKLNTSLAESNSTASKLGDSLNKLKATAASILVIASKKDTIMGQTGQINIDYINGVYRFSIAPEYENWIKNLFNPFGL